MTDIYKYISTYWIRFETSESVISHFRYQQLHFQYVVDVKLALMKTVPNVIHTCEINVDFLSHNYHNGLFLPLWIFFYQA